MHPRSSLTKKALQTLAARQLRYRYRYQHQYSTAGTAAPAEVKPLTSILIANRGEIAMFATQLVVLKSEIH